LPRTQRFANTFFPDAVKIWNTIMPDFKEMPDLDELKKHLLALFRPQQKSIYNVHDPINTKHLYQLRLGLSSLRSHKKHHNFADTPSDICLCKTGAENTSHFLFHCPFYASHRAKLASSIMTVLIPYNLNHLANSEKLYLYGDDSLPFEDNKKIILATIEYIKNTNRFA
jgi:hypothetical protein